MTFYRAISIAVAFTVVLAPELTGRTMVVLPYQDLLDKSELVVIATPITKSTDTAERSFLPNSFLQKPDGAQGKIASIGVETTFKVSAFLKGDKSIQQFVMHHYREASESMAGDGPALVSFDPSDISKRRSFLMFLIRESDGRYAPTSGQTDPGGQAIFTLPFLDRL